MFLTNALQRRTRSTLYTLLKSFATNGMSFSAERARTDGRMARENKIVKAEFLLAADLGWSPLIEG